MYHNTVQNCPSHAIIGFTDLTRMQLLNHAIETPPTVYICSCDILYIPASITHTTVVHIHTLHLTITKH